MPNNENIRNFIVQLLNTHIPETYYYHNLSHTLYVEQQCLEIGKHEHCSKEELKLLSIAALWHDTGYINTYQKHEEESCKLAQHYLPNFGITPSEIDIICGMIMATKIPQKPKTKLEEIIADADLEYLSTAMAPTLAKHLFKEINTLNPNITPQQWNETEIKFISEHHYFTKYCQENKEVLKQGYLKSLREQRF